MSETDVPALVIGYGNPLRQDDGAGWAVIDALEQAADKAALRTMAVHQLTPELVLAFEDMQAVVFVDACCTSMGGAVVSWELRPSAAPTRGSVHHCKPEDLLRQARDLLGLTPRAYMVCIGVEELGFGETLSKPVRAAIPRAVERVKNLVETGANPLLRWAAH